MYIKRGTEINGIMVDNKISIQKTYEKFGHFKDLKRRAAKALG